MSAPPLQVETTGETVGEAKWAALRELAAAPRAGQVVGPLPGRLRSERGLLGVGYAPARVIASLDEPPEPLEETDDARQAREVVETIVDALGVRCRVDVRDDGETVTVTCTGSDLGLLIGKHGQTIDAIQYLANAIARRRPDARTSSSTLPATARDAVRRWKQWPCGARRRRCGERGGQLRADDQHRPQGRPPSAEGFSRRHHREAPGTEAGRYVVIRPGSDERLRRWVDELVATPGLTAIDNPETAWRARRAAAGGAGDRCGDTTGRSSTSARRRLARDPARGGTARSRGHAARGAGAEGGGAVALRRVVPERARRARARGRAAHGLLRGRRCACLAQPPVAAEWCLPLVRNGGAVVLFVGPGADRDAVARSPSRSAAGCGTACRRTRDPEARADSRGVPAAPGVAKKRPLA